MRSLRREEGADILIVARTDARQAASLEEALWRAEAFADAGALFSGIGRTPCLRLCDTERRVGRSGGTTAFQLQRQLLQRRSEGWGGGGWAPSVPATALAHAERGVGGGMCRPTQS